MITKFFKILTFVFLPIFFIACDNSYFNEDQPNPPYNGLWVDNQYMYPKIWNTGALFSVYTGNSGSSFLLVNNLYLCYAESPEELTGKREPLSRKEVKMYPSSLSVGDWMAVLDGLRPNTDYYYCFRCSNDYSYTYVYNDLESVQTFQTANQSNSQFQDNIDNSISPASGRENGYEYVNLGLSVSWATCNVGASSSEDYGDHFAWGAIEPNEVSKHGSGYQLTKYCTDSDYGNDGFKDNKRVLELEDDAAAMNWGGKWRMPTWSEMYELQTKCTWKWINRNGVYGCKIVGPNGNSIFLPAAGYNNTMSLSGQAGYYWSSTLATYCNEAEAINILPGTTINEDYYRTALLSIRPVLNATSEEPEDPNTPSEEPDNPTPPSQLNGRLSISATKQVTFSPGNLQYHPANNIWRFAEKQTDYIGDANGNISSTYDGWIDLFGWSTAENPTNISNDDADYPYSFIDWGINKIGSDAPNTWRTLTYDEWNYLLNTRRNASSLKGVAQVDGVNGLIFLPDNWSCPKDVTFKSGFHSENGEMYYSEYQTFTANQWIKLEQSGAVFLPAAGDRKGESMYEFLVQYSGDYYSSSIWLGTSYVIHLIFYSHKAYFSAFERAYGFSVRLVKDL